MILRSLARAPTRLRISVDVKEQKVSRAKILSLRDIWDTESIKIALRRQELFFTLPVTAGWRKTDVEE